MISLVLKESELKRLKEYPLDNNIVNTESIIYYYKRDYFTGENLLLKKLYDTRDTKVERKIKTIETLQESPLMEYKELVIPQDVISIQGIKSGFTIKEITNNTNLQLILNNNNISTSKKIELLKKIGELLNKVTSQEQEFYFGDLQPSNILVDEEDNIFVVDLDSSAVNRKKPLETKYIVFDHKTHDVRKYKVNKAKRAYPSKDIDIYCFNTMVLNTIAGEPIHRTTIPEYYEYLNYLDDKGISRDILDIFSNHYSNKPNESVYPYLDELPKQIGKEQYKVYKMIKSKKSI